MTTLIFRDYSFTAQHHLPNRTGAAMVPHWHDYTVRMWFEANHCQDKLGKWMQDTFLRLQYADLNTLDLADTSDEGLAAIFLAYGEPLNCVRVRVTTDGRRGAEVSV